MSIKENLKNNSLSSLDNVYNIDIEEVISMSKMVNVNFKMNEDDKKQMEQVCKDIGLSMSSAFTIFAKKVAREHRIPFELNSDQFYSESNVAFLMEGVKALNEGKGVKHDLIEEDE